MTSILLILELNVQVNFKIKSNDFNNFTINQYVNNFQNSS